MPLVAAALTAGGPIAAPSVAPAATQKQSPAGAKQARIGGRGFGSPRPTFGRRPPGGGPPAAPPAGPAPPPFPPRVFWRGVRAPGGAHPLHLLFGGGAGG